MLVFDADVKRPLVSTTKVGTETLSPYPDAVTPESIKKLLDCEHDVSIIPYTLKNIDWDKLKKQIQVKPDLPLSVLGMGYPIHLKEMNDITCTKGFIEIERGTTGCMMIKRRVFEKMIKEYPQLKIHQESLFNGEMKKHNNLYNFFDTYSCKTSTTA